MALPKQVQQQIEEAERIQQELQGTPAANGDTSDPPQPPAPPEPPVAATPEPTPPQPAVDEWQERYKALQGKYNAEITRANEAQRQMAAQLQTLQQQIAQLQQRPPEPPKAPDPLVTSQDEDKFGSDLIEVTRRVAREELRSVLGRLDALETLAKNVAAKAQRVDEVAQDVAQTREQAFWSELTKAVPNWEEVNRDERWLKWLAEFDPIAGRTRQQALEEAHGRLDHQRVAALFKLFLSQVTPAQPDQTKAELARQVAPAKSSKTTAQPQGAKTYTGREYNYWLDPRRVHDTDNAQLQAMLGEMERALMENRIQW